VVEVLDVLSDVLIETVIQVGCMRTEVSEHLYGFETAISLTENATLMPTPKTKKRWKTW